MNAVEISDVDVTRGGTRVLHHVALTVPAGRVVGLLGPSGCGKTTLMRAIVGVQARVTGRIEVLGHPAGDPALRTRVGYMTQAPSIYGDLTVRENLAFFARVLGVQGGRVDEVIDLVDLADVADRVVGSFSGGQRARVSLATTLLGEPDLLVLDEPTVGLDPVLRRRLWRTFHRLAEGGTALLVSSHVMDEATSCDELVLMRDGRVLAAGTNDELLARAGAPDIEAAFLALVGEP